MAIEEVTLPNGRKRVFITAGTTEWPDPGDWNPDDNIVECLSNGGHGGAGFEAIYGGGGGGAGGSYAVGSNLSLTFPVPCSVAVSPNGIGNATNFNKPGLPNASYTGSDPNVVSAPCPNQPSMTAGGNPAGAAPWPTGHNGGRGGNGAIGGDAGGGGGGAAGPNGAGGNGTNGVASQGVGGSANGGTPGVTTLNGAAGANGTAWSANHGPGSGGAGGVAGRVGGAGGRYGGGGGGGSGSGSGFAGGAGGDGLIVVTYLPLGQAERHWLFDDVTWSSSTRPWTGTLGVEFFPATLIYVHGIRYFNHSSHDGANIWLWDVATQEVIASAFAPPDPTLAWRTVLFDAPIVRDHGQSFIASYEPTSGGGANIYVNHLRTDIFFRPGPVFATSNRRLVGATGFPSGKETNFYLIDIIFSTNSWHLGLVKGAGGENLALISPDDDAELDNPAWLQIRNGPIQAVEVVKIPRVDWTGLP